LAQHLLGFFVRQSGKAISGFAEPVREAIVRYPWPGNIRELRNVVERGVILASGPWVELHHLPAQVSSPAPIDQERDAPVTLDQIEADHIRRTLAATATIDEAAAKLGIDPSTLYRKRKRYGI
jgi:NtrC-family two-component system response regulator AlgB